MSRGDETKAPIGSPRARARGLPIAAAFGVFVLIAAFFTLWLTHGVERLFANGLFGGGSFPQEPFPGARSALSGVGWRGCLGGEVGPTVGTTAPVIDTDSVDTALALRGYLADGAWSEPFALPFEQSVDGLRSSCGLVAFVAEGASYLSSGDADRGGRETVCDPHVLLLSMCDEGDVSAVGVGTARMRIFSAPGLTPDVLRATRLPVDIALAHAEAASALSVAGWVPTDEIIGVRVPASTATYGVNVRAPKTPTSGCLAYVAVGSGLGRARIYWPGTPLREEPTVDRFVATPVACGGTPYFDGSMSVEDAGRDGGQVYFRAYSPSASGPAIPAVGVRKPLEFTMQLVRAVDAVMPTPVPLPAAP